MINDIKNIKKIIAKETKIISQKYAADSEDNLTIKITDKEIKNALKINPEDKKPLAKFTNDFITQMRTFEEYNVPDAGEINIEFDPKTNPIYIEQFKKAWEKFFAVRIYRKDKDIKEVQRKNIISFIFGLLSLLVVIAFGVTAVYYDSKAFLTSAVVIDAVFSILSWVLFWEFFYDIIYTIPGMRKKMTILYKMYKVIETTENK